jgi:hypothetical protein
VDVVEVDENRKVVYESTGSRARSRVTITLTRDVSGMTVVAINESGWPMDREGVNRALGQASGWTYFLCCLKACPQHGINLRLGLNRRLNEADQPSPRGGGASRVAGASGGSLAWRREHRASR